MRAAVYINSLMKFLKREARSVLVLARVSEQGFPTTMNSSSNFTKMRSASGVPTFPTPIYLVIMVNVMHK